jgi:hypothetical protein
LVSPLSAAASLLRALRRGAADSLFIRPGSPVLFLELKTPAAGKPLPLVLLW